MTMTGASFFLESFFLPNEAVGIKNPHIAHKRILLQARAAFEWSLKKGSFDRISNCQKFWNFENWKLEIENIFCFVCELQESENHPPVISGGGWLDY